MTLIKSISGIRGIIGGKSGNSLSPIDTVKFASAYGAWLLEEKSNKKVVIGRDARLSGEMISRLVVSSLQGLGIEVIDLGLATTPTVEMAVAEWQAGGGIIVTASHNPGHWNALKFLNAAGEFISEDNGKRILELAASEDYDFAPVGALGAYRQDSFLDEHINKILALPLVDKEAIKERNFKIVVDGVNSVGGIAVPALLKALGVQQIEEMFCEPNGHFPHNPEPLPENLNLICNKLQGGSYDLGIVVDPDVDRLAFIAEDGTPFGEEYTLVAIADYVLQHQKGSAVSNLSSTRALRDVARKYGCDYFAAAVGEVNVVATMKQQNAVIGGEGNGGIIYPELHYGRDALVGIALFLTYLAKTRKSANMLRATYPSYHISKNKIELTPEINVENVLFQIQKKYEKYPTNTIDGVKIDFENEWVHLRRSNTEPIIRIYVESENQSTANTLANKIISDIKEIIKM